MVLHKQLKIPLSNYHLTLIIADHCLTLPVHHLPEVLRSVDESVISAVYIDKVLAFVRRPMVEHPLFTGVMTFFMEVVFVVVTVTIVSSCLFVALEIKNYFVNISFIYWCYWSENQNCCLYFLHFTSL